MTFCFLGLGKRRAIACGGLLTFGVYGLLCGCESYKFSCVIRVGGLWFESLDKLSAKSGRLPVGVY